MLQPHPHVHVPVPSRQRVTARLLPDGRRLHLNDGPIDLIIEAFGPIEAISAAYRAAIARFDGLLDELCAELPILRSAASHIPRAFDGPVATRMERAVVPHARKVFITPMAAVAGGVADEILAHMLEVTGDTLTRAFVNNGGDIAIHLAARERFTVGLVDRPDRPRIMATSEITAEDSIGGIATSGAPGRSFSLGIADAVTVLARTAAEADAAATIIANAVDLPGDARIARAPAASLQPDSDLGHRLVTVAVAPLDPASIARALAQGVTAAKDLMTRGLLSGACLHLQGATRAVGLAGIPHAEEAARVAGSKHAKTGPSRLPRISRRFLTEAPRCEGADPSPACVARSSHACA